MLSSGNLIRFFLGLEIRGGVTTVPRSVVATARPTMSPDGPRDLRRLSDGRRSSRSKHWVRGRSILFHVTATARMVNAAARDNPCADEWER